MNVQHTNCIRCALRPAVRLTGPRWCDYCWRDYTLRRRYGIGVEVYDALLAQQEGRCAICRTDRPSPKPNVVNFFVDHDPETGVVRGLLCLNCNHRLLGAANHDPEVLDRAAAHLRGANRLR